MHASLLTTTIGRYQSELREGKYSHASEVTGVIALVAACTETKDWKMLRAQFLGEVELHFGKMKSPQRLSADAYVAWASQAYGCGSAKHSVRFHEVRINVETGNLANVTSYWQLLYGTSKDEKAEPPGAHFWCDHELVRTEDGWKISRVWATTLEEKAFTRWDAQVSAIPARPTRSYR